MIRKSRDSRLLVISDLKCEASTVSKCSTIVDEGRGGRERKGVKSEELNVKTRFWRIKRPVHMGKVHGFSSPRAEFMKPRLSTSTIRDIQTISDVQTSSNIQTSLNIQTSSNIQTS